MVNFKNNNRRGRFRNNDRNFRRNNDGMKYKTDFVSSSKFQRKSPGKNNHNASKLVEKYNDLAREAIANEAFKRKTGARALRSIIEELMLDIMYTLPSQEEVKEFTITKKMVDNLFSSKIVKLPSGSNRIIKESA